MAKLVKVAGPITSMFVVTHKEHSNVPMSIGFRVKDTKDPIYVTCLEFARAFDEIVPVHMSNGTINRSLSIPIVKCGEIEAEYEIYAKGALLPNGTKANTSGFKVLKSLSIDVVENMSSLPQVVQDRFFDSLYGDATGVNEYINALTDLGIFKSGKEASKK